MKRNNIDTAPTYTNIYDKPIKLYPTNINILDIFINKPIKNNTDIIGFLLTIVNIPKKIDIKKIISTISIVNPLLTKSFNKIILPILNLMIFHYNIHIYIISRLNIV